MKEVLSNIERFLHTIAPHNPLNIMAQLYLNFTYQRANCLSICRPISQSKLSFDKQILKDAKASEPNFLLILSVS